MRAVIQRVKRASVTIGGKEKSSIENGFLLLLGIKDGDTKEDAAYIIEKTVNLRVFEDEDEKMNLSIQDTKGSVLIVSQFTLYADARKGRRPSFIKAARQEQAIPLYNDVIDGIKKYVHVETGEFQAIMDVELVNDGPVTILLDSEKAF